MKNYKISYVDSDSAVMCNSTVFLPFPCLAPEVLGFQLLKYRLPLNLLGSSPTSHSCLSQVPEGRPCLSGTVAPPYVFPLTYCVVHKPEQFQWYQMQKLMLHPRSTEYNLQVNNIPLVTLRQIKKRTGLDCSFPVLASLDIPSPPPFCLPRFIQLSHT